MTTTSEVRRVTEARTPEALPGDRTMGEFREVLTNALKETFGASAGSASPSYLYIEDCTDTWAVYELEGPDGCKQFRVEFTMADDGTVTFGDPVEVEEKTTYEPVVEAVRVESGRVIEAKGNDAAGGRIFAVQIIATGTSRNGVRYPATVLESAAPLYEGAKAFDHHRTEAELRTSTVAGLVGHYENVAANASGITADLHVLPSMAHIAEALDASIQAQDKGLPPVVGISHDVQAALTPAVEGGRRIQEATAITAVLSADVVADPSAGGRATRVVAGGIGSDPQNPTSRKDTDMTLKQLLSLLRQAEAADRDGLLQEHAAVIEAAGYTADEVIALAAVVESPEAPGGPAAGTGTADAPAEDKEPVLVTESLQGRMLIKAAVADAGLEDGMVAIVTEGLGARFTEGELVRTVAGYQRVLEGVERRGLNPRAGHVQVTEEDLDKKREKVHRTFEGNFQEGYSSLKEMYLDVTGQHHRFGNWSSPDLAYAILREAFAGAPAEGRVSESISASTFGNVLADAMNRRMVAEYSLDALAEWRQVVSSTVPLNDFRQQKVVRYGGYGTLPTVAERGPYQPLTTPTDEKVTYVPTKKGGTEDFSFEAAANDDLGALVRIPQKLGRAAAQTIYRAVFDLFPSNPTLYDSVALFHSSHANTDNPAVLTSTTLATGRRKMRKQAAYGNSVEVLGTTPKFLLVPSDLEELAYQLTASAVAIPSSGNASNIPNLHQGMTPLVIDYWSDTNDWFIAGDPSTIPTIEVGFLNGRQDPELFVQDSPTVGSNFNSDVITWKIRHIWGLAVLDYRGFYRGAN